MEPRKASDLCKLCRTNPATQRNSHIVPKFLGKGIFEGVKPRHGTAVDRTGLKKKVQDIAKEDFLFCPDCEKSFSIYESYCSARLERFNMYSRYFKQFGIYNDEGTEFFECKQLDIRIFNLFIRSIVWRLSACHSMAFSTCNLPTEAEEALRNNLSDNIFLTQNELSAHLYEIEGVPDHYHVIFRPRKKLRPPKSHLSAASLNNSIHQLHLVDYVVFYILDSSVIPPGLMKINNSSFSRNVRVGLVGEDQWEKFNFDQVREWKAFSGMD